MNARIFIGLPLTDNYQNLLAEHVKDYADHPKIRLIDPQNYHLTLCFIGDISTNVLQNVLSTVQFICNRHKSFTLSFNRISLAPAKRDARMIWAKFLVEPAFSELSNDLCQIFTQLQIDHKHHSRPIPHVTLARFPEGKPPQLTLKKIPKRMLICNQVYVWQSTIEAGKRLYKPLQIYTLKQKMDKNR